MNELLDKLGDRLLQKQEKLFKIHQTLSEGNPSQKQLQTTERLIMLGVQMAAIVDAIKAGEVPASETQSIEEYLDLIDELGAALSKAPPTRQ